MAMTSGWARGLVVAAVGLGGCAPNYLYSPPQKESGFVRQLVYSPGGHGTGTGFSVLPDGRVSVVPIDVYTPERFGIVLECGHGTIGVENREDLWRRLKVGQRVVITYKDRFLSHKRGMPEKVDGHEFVDAEPVSP